MSLEIERKFVVIHPPPEAAERVSVPIDQGYLALGDDEVRVRRKGASHYLTYKRGFGLARVEVEVVLDAEQFAALWPMTEGRRVEKTRTAIPYEGVTIELDTYGGALVGLLTAEVEFADERQAHAFVPPPWFGDEVTGDRRYRNQALALDGRPA